MEHGCRCGELPQYRANNETLREAKLILQRIGESNRMIQYLCNRVSDGTECAYDSEKKYDIVQNINYQKRNLESNYNELLGKIQRKSTQISNELSEMEYWDRRFHIAEAIRKKEEDMKRKYLDG